MGESENPKDLPLGGALGLPDEKALDEALAQAADLAAGLTAEVRDSPAPLPKTSVNDDRLGIEQELKQLERLTEKAVAEISDDSPPPALKKKKRRASPAVPDFMSEFTEPQSPRGDAPAADPAPPSSFLPLEVEPLATQEVGDSAAGPPTLPSAGPEMPAPAPSEDEPADAIDAPDRRLAGMAAPDAADTQVNEAITEDGPSEAAQAPVEPGAGDTRGAPRNDTSASDIAAPSAPQSNADDAPSNPPAKATPPEAPAANATEEPGSSKVLRGGDSKPGVVGTGMLGVVGNIPNAKRDSDAAKEKKKKQAEEPKEPTVQKSSWGSSKTANTLLPAAERLVNILEWLDRPFGWIRMPIRNGLGMFAIATLITSVVVVIIAMLL